MADQKSIEMLAFSFASRTFAYRRLAQRLSRALLAFFSIMRKCLDRIDQSRSMRPIAANDANQLIKNMRATFECIKEACLKLTMNKCLFDATEIDFLGRTITTEGVKPHKERVTNHLEKTNFPKSKKAWQRYLGFHNYYRN